MKIAVFGAGAIGGYLAVKLHQAGAQVSVIARGPHLAAMREHGLDVSDLHMDVDHSPYSGMTLRGWAESVFLRGAPVVERGTFVGELGAGRYLARAPIPT